MEQMKATYEKLNANQQELLETLNAKLQEAMAIFEPDAKLEAFTKEMLEAQMESGKTYLTTLATEDKPEKFMETYMSAFQQYADTQATNMEKATEFFTEWWEQFNWETTSTHLTKLGDIYQASFEAIWNTTNANAKLMQNMFIAKA